MARKAKPYIKTESYVHRQDGSLVRLADLPKETREKVGRQLMVEYCNTLYAGLAEFFYPDENVKEDTYDRQEQGHHPADAGGCAG